MASEDSDELVSRFPTIHGLGDLRDLDETFGRLVPTCGDELHAVRELLEVHLLGALHRMLPKERNDRLQQISTSPYDVAQHVLPMIVAPVVRDHIAYAEELTKVLEARNARRTLRDRELVRDLISDSVASSPRTVWLPYEADREAPFSVYKADHPATELDQPFLLVFRTRHVVTMVNARSDVTR